MTTEQVGDGQPNDVCFPVSIYRYISAKCDIEARNQNLRGRPRGEDDPRLRGKFDAAVAGLVAALKTTPCGAVRNRDEVYAVDADGRLLVIDKAVDITPKEWDET